MGAWQAPAKRWLMMEREMAFHILGIDAAGRMGGENGADRISEEMVRRAYREHLRSANPEDDPDGFKRLREAYEAALLLVRQAEMLLEESDGADAGNGGEAGSGGNAGSGENTGFGRRGGASGRAGKTEVDDWIDQVGEVYDDITLRYRTDEWEELLANPVCEGLDTSLEAREKALVFLMDHIYLPQPVWRLLDSKFQLVEDQKALAEKFPGNFLDYVVYYVEHEGFIPFHFFQVINELEYEADSYLQHYFSIKKKIDGKDGENCLQELDDLKAFGVWHPYEEVERIRLFLDRNRTDEAAAMAKRLAADYPGDNYIGAYAGQALYAQGQKDEACGLWQKVLNRAPDYYAAKLGIIKYQMDQRDYYGARERMMEILELDGSDQEVMELLHTANEAMIAEYRGKLERNESDERLSEPDMALEIGWCLFQNERLDEAIDYLGSFHADAAQEYGYSNLYGRVLYQAKQYERALPHLERWLELIEATEDDGGEENRKRRSRRGRACYILSGCCHSLGREEEAERYARRAVEVSVTMREKMGCMQYLSTILCEMKQYEKAVDICDELIREDENYYPAYLTRQEACFELKKAQAVVDDYHRAVRIFAGYYKPYLLAAKVFYYYNQFEDAKGVIEEARENQVEFSQQMKLFEVKILRNLARSNEARKRPLEICGELLKVVGSGSSLSDETDIEDLSEVEFETGLLHWDNDENDEAISHVNEAIRQNPERLQYRLVRGNIYLDMKKYSEALAEYSEAGKEYSELASLYYNMGLCYEGKGLKTLAVEHFEKAAQLQEGYRDSLEKLSDYYHDRYRAEYRREDYEKALSYMDRQLAVTENCYYLVCRGRIYMTAYEFQKAIADFERALEYTENDWAALNNIGCCYKYMGEFRTAIGYYARSVNAMEDHKNALPYSNMADCYEALGDFLKAIDCYKKDLELFPEYAVFYSETGKLFCYLGKFDDAARALEKTRELDSYYKNMADLWYRRGNKRKALGILKEGVQKANAEKKAERLCDLGEFCMEYLHNFPLAVFWLKRAISFEGVHSVMFECEWRLAWAYFVMKKPGKAKRHGERALEHLKQSGNGTESDYLAFGQSKPARNLRLAWIYLAMGQTKKGLELFEEMDHCYRCRNCRSGGCYEKYLYLGAYQETIGQPGTAMELYETAKSFKPHSMEVKSAIEKLRRKMKG